LAIGPVAGGGHAKLAPMRAARPVTCTSIGLAWPGKDEARAAADTPCSGRLIARAADPNDTNDTNDTNNANSANSENAVIEGDNLHVLKLLQADHAAAIKLAYLDPPYDLGRDTVYADNFGRAAADWLTMMYPRLILTRELLRPDGIVCVSIDDARVAQLRLLCDEIFGAHNHVATFTWETKRAARGVPPRSLLMHNHEYVVCYAQDHRKVRFRGLDRDAADFANPDDDPRGPWRSESMKATGNQHNFFTITDPVAGTGFHANWAFSPATLRAMISDGRVLFPPSADGTPRQKKFRDSYRNDTKAAVTSLGWHSTERATKALMELFDGAKVFSFPKPLSLLEFFCAQLLGPGDTVLDPFAGSGTTGHAVHNLNLADQGQRRFVLVQQAEALDGRHVQQRAAAAFCDRQGLPRTIAALTRERLRRAGADFRAYELLHE
jgi:adenine-specific DNA-methyltransferase